MEKSGIVWYVVFMSTEKDQKPPENIKELGIHFTYMRRDINDLMSILKENNYVKTVDVIEMQKAADEVHSEINRRIDLIEDWRDRLIAKVAGAAIVFLVLLVLSLVGLEKYLKL